MQSSGIAIMYACMQCIWAQRGMGPTMNSFPVHRVADSGVQTVFLYWVPLGQQRGPSTEIIWQVEEEAGCLWSWHMVGGWSNAFCQRVAIEEDQQEETGGRTQSSIHKTYAGQEDWGVWDKISVLYRIFITLPWIDHYKGCWEVAEPEGQGKIGLKWVSG